MDSSSTTRTQRFLRGAVGALLAANAVALVTLVASDDDSPVGVESTPGAEGSSGTTRTIALVTKDGRRILVDPSTPEGQQAIEDARREGTAIEQVTTTTAPGSSTTTTVPGTTTTTVRGATPTTLLHTDTIDKTVDDVTDTVHDSVDDVNDTVHDTVDDVTDAVDGATGGATDDVTDVVDDANDTVHDTVDDANDTVEDTVDDTVDDVTDTIDDAGGTVGGLLGGL